MNLISRGILIFLVGISLVGCASVKSTAQFYIPTTTKVYPPKPKDAQIPIMGQPPKQPYEVIGHLAFSSYNGFNFFRRSMEYNARQAGADGVILRGMKTQVFNAPYYVPPSVDYVPVVNYYNCGKNGKTQAYVTSFPVFTPGYSGNFQNVLTTIDAQMILFKKSR